MGVVVVGCIEFVASVTWDLVWWGKVRDFWEVVEVGRFLVLFVLGLFGFIESLVGYRMVVVWDRGLLIKGNS